MLPLSERLRSDVSWSTSAVDHRNCRATPPQRHAATQQRLDGIDGHGTFPRHRHVREGTGTFAKYRVLYDSYSARSATTGSACAARHAGIAAASTTIGVTAPRTAAYVAASVAFNPNSIEFRTRAADSAMATPMTTPAAA